MVGNSRVGKSSLLSVWSDNTFTESFIPTVGVDFKKKTLELNGKTIAL